MDHVSNLEDFQTDVIARSANTPVLVDFWAPWCGPCRMLGPVLEGLAAQADGRWVLIKVNTDEHQELAAQFGIRGIPDVKLFHRGEVIAQFSGALPESHVRRWLDENLPTTKRTTMAQARALLHAGRASEAVRLLQPLQREEPHDAELAALTARALVFQQPAKAAVLIDALPPNHPWEEAAGIVRVFARLFAVADQPPGAVAASPWWERYYAAIRSLQAEAFEDAFINLIAVLQERPDFDDGHARAAGLALLKHLGLRHPISEKYARALSMAVNV